MHGKFLWGPAIAIVLATPAWGQAGAVRDAVPTATDDADQTQEIIVTATKRAVPLDRSAGSITAITARTLSDRSVNTLDEAFATAANVRFEPTTQQGPALNIRGIDTQTNGVGFEPGVSVYIDEIYQARPSSFTSVLADIDRIEVLRGPQGTVFGKNTVGGLLHIVTKKPINAFEVSGDLTYGSRSLKQARLTLNAPLIDDTLALRITGVARDIDGYERNTTPGAKALYGEGFGGVRGHLLYTPGSRVEVLLSADYGKTTGTGDQHLDIDGNPGDRVTSVGTGGLFRREAYGLSGRVTVKTNAFDIISLSSYRRTDSLAVFDQDFTPAPGVLTRFPELDKTFSQEVRLVSSLDGPFKFIVGGYYLHDKTVNSIQALFGNDAGPPSAIVDTTISTNSYAGFVSAEYKLTDRLKVTGGARYTQEDKQFDFSTIGVAPLPIGSVASNGSLSQGAWSGDIGLNFQATRTLFLYAKAARGFKAGGFDNVSAFQSGALTTIATGGFIPFDIYQFVFRPEHADNYELGFKWASRDGRFHLYGSGFYTDYRDKQEQITRNATLGGITVPLATTANAGGAEIYGVELEGSAAPVKWWRVEGSLGYLSAKYTSFIDPAGGVDLTGLTLQRAPRWNASLANTVFFDAPAGLRGSLRAEGVYTSTNYLDPSNDPFAVQKAHIIVNLRAGVEAKSGRYGLFIFGKNVTNSNVFLAANPSIGAIPIAPATWGAELKFHF